MEQVSPGFGLDGYAKLFAISAPICVVLAFVFEWAYLRGLGLSFAEVPIQLTDYIKAALIWFPSLAISFFCYASYELLSKRIESWETEDEIVRKSANPSRLKKFRDSPYRFIAWNAGLVIVLWALLGEKVAAFEPFFVAPVLWMAFATWVFEHPNAISRTTRNVRLFFVFVPASLLLIYGIGFSRASEILAKPSATAAITVKVGSEKFHTYPVKLLRSYDKGFLVGWKDQRIGFIKAEEVVRIEYLVPRSNWRGLLCLFGWQRACL